MTWGVLIETNQQSIELGKSESLSVKNSQVNMVKHFAAYIFNAVVYHKKIYTSKPEPNKMIQRRMRKEILMCLAALQVCDESIQFYDSPELRCLFWEKTFLHALRDESPWELLALLLQSPDTHHR